MGVTVAGEAGKASPEIRSRAIKVKGCGFWNNRMLKKVVWMLLPPEGSRPEILNADFIEDGVSMMQAELADWGYLRPTMDLELELVSGETRWFHWQWDTMLLLPRPLQVRKATFHVQRGVRYYYASIEFRGLQALSESDAEGYFRGAEFLLRQKSTRIYSRANANRSKGHLEGALRQLGYAEAMVERAGLEMNHQTGAVELTVAVDEGPSHRVRTTVERVLWPGESEVTAVETNSPNAIYSDHWLEDWRLALRRRYYREGYADARVVVKETAREVEGAPDSPDRVLIDLEATVEPGKKQLLGEIHFSGNKKTRESYLLSRSRIETGEPLNPLQVQEARYRLTRTGLFDGVQYRLDDSELETDPPSRDVTFELQEAKYTRVGLLAGYGSYELLRGGIEWEQRNLFGVGHNSRLKLVQAIRASRADLDYSVPGLFNTAADGFINFYAKQRDEPEFRRRDVGGSVGVERPVDFLRSRVGLRYTHEYLDARHTEVVEEYGALASRAASLSLQLVHDRRDNALSPGRGHHLFARAEVASESLGGEANYQLYEIGGSYHLRFRGGRYIHLGASHGIVRPQGDRSENLPFGKRFFPGGESSIRGYQETEASPRDAAGDLVGAESYWLVNVELEQALTAAWSVVVFSDTAGVASDIEDYPSNEVLTSVGLGVRWKTPVGPVRLEYGYNLNPRPRDPSGTLLFSIGFPF